MEPKEAKAIRKRLEVFEGINGRPLEKAMRHQSHLLFTWMDKLIRNNKILDEVEKIIGPNILCWGSNLFIKEPKTKDFISWHQDATYWGLEPLDKIVTAWVAISDVPVESGAMKFLPESHKWGQREHQDTYSEKNLLSRGQEIAVEVNEEDAVDVVLKAGEFSLHHVLLAHGSHKNISGNRRIGCAIRYIPTAVRQTISRNSAVLVRGKDDYDHFDLLDSPETDLSEKAISLHAHSTSEIHSTVHVDAAKD